MFYRSLGCPIFSNQTSYPKTRLLIPKDVNFAYSEGLSNVTSLSDLSNNHYNQGIYELSPCILGLTSKQCQARNGVLGRGSKSIDETNLQLRWFGQTPSTSTLVIGCRSKLKGG